MSRKHKTEFDPDTHTYRINGFKVPSVTEVISELFGSKPYWTEWHRNRGKALHSAIHLALTQQLDWDSVDIRIMGRLHAALKFVGDYQIEPEFVEQSYFDPIFRYAGTPDLVGKTSDGKKVLVDFKSSIEPTVEFQLGGYALLVSGKRNYFSRAVAVGLKDDGTYKEREIEDIPVAQGLFMSALQIYHWKERNGLIVKDFVKTADNNTTGQ